MIRRKRARNSGSLRGRSTASANACFTVSLTLWPSARASASMGVSAVYNPDRNEARLGVDPVASTVCRRSARS